MPTRKEQAAKTRKLIEDTARELLQTTPVDQLTISAIAKACGIAKGTLYVHFKSKDELLVSLLYVSTKAQFVEMQNHPTMSFREKVVGYIDMRLSDLANSGSSEIAQNLLSYRMTKAYRDFRDVEMSYVKNYEFCSLKTIFQRAIQKGELDPETPVDRMCHYILYGCYGAYVQGCLWSDLSLISDWREEFITYVFEDLLGKYCLT